MSDDDHQKRVDEHMKQAAELRAKYELSHARWVGAARAAVVLLLVYLAWTGIADHRRASAFEDACAKHYGERVYLQPLQPKTVVVDRHFRYFFTEDGGYVCVYMDLP